MILTTTPQIEGRPIREYKGVVTGETIIGANMFKDFLAGIRDIVGGRAGSYEKVLMEAKDTSLQEMMQRAMALGANAIVGIDIDYETIGGNGSGCHQWNSSSNLSHNIPEHLVLLQVWTFCDLSDIVTNQVTPIVTLHTEVTFVIFFMTLYIDIVDGRTFVQFHHVMH